MRYQTDLMRAILTNETAQEIIDWVSQLYGESYVGLWIYQVMGVILGEVRAMAEQLRQEVRPSTAEELLSLWEEVYGLTAGDGLSVEQRQARLLDRKLTRSPANPAKLEQLVRSMTGCPVRVTENVAPYTFTVEVFCEGREVDFDAVLRSLRRIKPSHQQMLVYMTAADGVQLRARRTTWRFPYPLAGTRPQINTPGGLTADKLVVEPEQSGHRFQYPLTGEPITGTLPQENRIGAFGETELVDETDGSAWPFRYPMPAGQPTGEHPQQTVPGAFGEAVLALQPDQGRYGFPYPPTGEPTAGTLPQENTAGIPLGGVLNASIETTMTAILLPLCGDSDA